MKTQKGFIKWILIIIIALIVLGYFGIDVREVIESPATQNNLNYAERIVSNVWHNYLKEPATYLWGIFVKYIWGTAVNNLEKMKNDEPTAIDESAPKVNEAKI